MSQKEKQSDSSITFLIGALFADQQIYFGSVPRLSAFQSLCCSNEWQSGDAVLIYCMVAQMEPRWKVSVIAASLR